jgi:hypothetical protein
MVSDTMDDVLDDEETEEETEEELNRVSRTLLLKSNGPFCYDILSLSAPSASVPSGKKNSVIATYWGKVLEQCNALLLLRSCCDFF